MKFTRLRLSGFKSFVEPTDLLIEAGLTGVVGPNGCGKSNLLEALRWVMGESSYKSMRAAGMDDVIFSGTTQRPSRNMAEVVVTMANEDRSAPPQHNDSDIIEITRRIEREAGSAYRINGRDVRARDVQLLFADVSTGARSPALVRQGQIGEIINAKPQARRLILEEAAGITGLHTRRHEAELKLKAAEQNLVRLEDVTSQLETQLNSLKRQARQAVKYKQISAEIRKLEAAGLYAAWKEAADQAERDSRALDEATRELAEHTRAASERLRHRDELGEKLPELREQEAMRAAALQRLTLERNALDEEERRTEARAKELQQRIDQIDSDLVREQELLGDTERVIERLSSEEAELKSANEQESELRLQAASALQLAADSLARSQEATDQAAAKLSELTARRNAILRSIEDQSARIARFEREADEAALRREALVAQFSAAGDGAILADAVEKAAAAASASELAANDAEAAVSAQRQSESEARGSFEEARRRAETLQAEVRTLNNLLKADSGGLWPPLVDAVQVARGYETALGAALGDEMEASADEAAPAHWRGLPPLDEMAPLPFGAEPLAQFVEGPPALARRIAHIGVVPRGIGQALQTQLKPGQRLVTREGDVWRWDGFTVAADAPGAAAKRLEERNRLAQLEASMAEAAKAADELRGQFEEAGAALEMAIAAERARRDDQRAAISAIEFARRALANHERQEAERLAQTASLDEAIRRIDVSLAEARGQLETFQGEAAALPVPDTLQAELSRLRETLNGERAQYAESRSRHDGLEREARARNDRIQVIASELGQWRERAKRGEMQIAQLKSRQEETLAAISELVSLPRQFEEKRARLMDALSFAEGERREAADALASGENAVRQADAELRAAQEQQAKSREEHARLESRLEGTRQRQAQCEHRISETLQCSPQEVLSGAGIESEDIPAPEQIEKKLLGLRDDRERLGAVNLRADEEAAAVAQQLETLVRERDDLVKAINKLRGGISSLNREGRQRLLDAFGTVNEKFGELFTTLFGGGKAELQLVESDDPLEAGLEIVANPPGKKPTTISLLSGGEQTLTALSLIFAVFLTNPSPICVLDEVDAPLDDHNVERFCNLLDAMLERTDTRFLIITHHPLTMARMHRLFGVTMMERGVSQLVSVNLQEAEALKEAS